MTRIIVYELLRVVILDLLYTSVYSDGGRLYPEFNPLVGRPFKLVCDTEANITNTVTISFPNGITAGYCDPPSSLGPVDCTGSAGYTAALNQTEDTVTISTNSIASDVNGTWKCTYLADTFSYKLVAPIREIKDESFTLLPTSFTDNITSETASISLSATYGCINLPVYFKWFVVDSASNKIDISGTSNAAENSSVCTSLSGFNGYTETKEVNGDVYSSNSVKNLNGSYRLGVEVHYMDEVTTLHSIKYFDTYFVFNPTSSVSKPSPVSTAIANYETITTVSYNITVLVEALTTTSDVSLTTYKATRALTESVNTVIYDSSFVANTEFYTTYSLSTTGVETHVPQSSFISSDMDTSMQASLLTTNSSVSMDLMSNNTGVAVSDATGILTTAFDSATSNTRSINCLTIHSSIVTPVFYTTDKLSATEVETAQLQSGIISSDFVTSMAGSSCAELSSVSTDFMNNKTSVTVSDTNAESFEGASSTAGILKTEYGATKSNTVSINCGISLIYTVTNPLFYATDQLSDMEVETSVLQSSLISSDLDTSIPTLNIAEEPIASTDIINIETVVTVSDTTTASF